MSTENIAQQFIDLIQRFICLRPKIALPEHVVEFRKKMQKLRRKMEKVGGGMEDHPYLFRVLILLSQSETPLTMSELSTELNVPMSTATRIMDLLVRGDMVERVNDPSDRRVVRVGISKNGHELYKAGVDYNRQRIERLLKDFSNEEKEQLLMLTQKLLDSLLNENAAQK